MTLQAKKALRCPFIEFPCFFSKKETGPGVPGWLSRLEHATLDLTAFVSFEPHIWVYRLLKNKNL